MDAASVYARIQQRLLQHRAAYFHPQFPRPLIEERLWLLQRTPFYVTPNYAVQFNASARGFTLNRLIRLGEANASEILAIFAAAQQLADALGVPPLVRDPNHASLHHYRNLLAVEAEGEYFLVYNPQASDPLDQFVPEKTLQDPFKGDKRAGVGELDVDVFATHFYIEPSCPDPLLYIQTMLPDTRALLISGMNRALLRSLHAHLQATPGLFCGRCVPYFHCRLHSHRLRAMVRRAQRARVSLRLLAGGAFYDLPAAAPER